MPSKWEREQALKEARRRGEVEPASISDPTPLTEVADYNSEAELLTRLSRIEAKLDRFLAEAAR